MSYHDVEARRQARMRVRRARLRRRRLGAVSSLLIVVGAVVGIALGSAGGADHRVRLALRNRLGVTQPTTGGRYGIPARADVGRPGHAAVPILMYHVINPPAPSAPFPGLYVPRAQFAAQMRALKRAGWHAVTLNELEANWTRGMPLGSGRPIVITFDNGYQSQYTNALPVLRRLGWVGIENIQLTGLPPSQGGLSAAQVRELISAGWELDTQGMSHADLVTLGANGLRHQVDTARKILRRRYGVPVDWFCYPSGHYDAAVIAAVRAAGFLGSTTVMPGWASRADNLYRLPRLRVLGGTTPAQLLAEIAESRNADPPPSAYL